MPQRVLVVASTFPASDTDATPAFVKDQIVAMKKCAPSTEYSVLAPHDTHTKTTDFTEHQSYDEYRFHYIWPFKLEGLTGRGIMPAIKANPVNYLLIPFLFIGEFIALLRLTIKLKPDYIYAHWFTPQAITSCWVGVITKTPFVFTTHAADVDVWRKIPLVGSSLVRWHTSKARAITAVSRRSMDKLKHFFPGDKWQSVESKSAIIPMGVNMNLDSTKIDTKKLKLDYKLADKTVLFFMGRLAEKKGISYLLEAFAKASDRSQLQLVIAGDGPLRSDIEKHIQQLGLSDDVSLVGYLSGQQKEDYLQLADIMVLPSIITDSGDAEGLPVVFMEGLAAGKICIATNESGADDIIEHTTSGYLVPHKDVTALSEAIDWSLSLDILSRSSIQANARQVAKQFDWKLVAKQHLDFFNQQINKEV